MSGSLTLCRCGAGAAVHNKNNIVLKNFTDKSIFHNIVLKNFTDKSNFHSSLPCCEALSTVGLLTFKQGSSNVQ